MIKSRIVALPRAVALDERVRHQDQDSTLEKIKITAHGRVVRGEPLVHSLVYRLEKQICFE